MSRNRRKNSKKGQVKQNAPVMAKEIDVNREEQYSKAIDIREKRINIVFKTIYVFAIFFAVIFVDMGNRVGKAVDIVYMCEACISAFFLILISYMVLYIINEMNCLKLYADDLSKNQIEITERSYSNIFSALTLSGLTSVLCFLGFAYGKDALTAQLTVSIFVALLMLRMLLLTIGTCFKDKKKRIIEHCVGCIIITVAIAFMFYGVGLSANI